MRSKAIFMALLAFAFGSVEAVPVTSSQAAFAARTWAKSGQRLGARIGSFVEKTTTLKTDDEETFYAVKMREGGTVIMSGDTDDEPVLGFTREQVDYSTIDKNSPLWALLNADLRLRRQARAQAAGTASAQTVPGKTSSSSYATATAAVPTVDLTKPAGRRWASLLPKTTAATANGVDAASPIPVDGNVLDDMRVDILLTTKWGQSDQYQEGGCSIDPCFNYYTPENSVCGCVATATAQLMRYHCWPTNDVAKFSKTCTYNNSPLLLESLGGPFDWTNMVETALSADPTECELQCQALGRLTYECGVAVEMEYTDTSSGAITADVPEALKKYFSYTNAVWCSVSTRLTNEESYRQNILYPSLDARCPVLFSIRGGLGGHAVVCDGYGYNDVGGEATPYVHINMGWNSQNDWWYNLPNIDVGNNPESFEGFDVLSGVGYDIFPSEGAGCHIISGRILDADGEPVEGATVTMGDLSVVSTNHGVFAFVSKKGVGEVDLSAESADGRYKGELTIDYAGGDLWGNDITISRPAVEVNGTEFSTLDRALACAATNENPTVRILLDVDLRRPFTITNSCTITATNPVAVASKILPKSGAKLTLAPGATVTFTNVAFAHNDQLTVDAQAGSVLKLSGTADLGEVRLATVENLRLAGALLSPIVVDAPFAKASGETFGRFSPWSAEAAATAYCLLDKYDEEAGGESYYDGEADRYQLRWKSGTPVPDAAAAARIEPEQAAYTNYRSLAVLFKYNQSGTATVLKSTRLTNHLELAASELVLRGEGDGLVLSPTDEAGFVVGEDASLTLTNLIVRGRSSANAFIDVQGGAFTLEKDASLQELNGTETVSGAIALQDGQVTMRPGSSIRKCANLGSEGNYGGGAIWMSGEGCVLNLEGGQITQCSTLGYGGAVFAADDRGEVNLSGPLTVYDNVSGFGDDVWNDDLYLSGSTLTLKDNLTGGYVGLTYVWEFPGADEPFCAVASELQGQVTDYTLECFLCEDMYGDEDLLAKVSDDGASLVWSEDAYSARTEPDPGVDVARIVRDDVTNYYYWIDGPRGAFGDLDDDGLVIELLQPCDFVEDIPVSRAVTVRLAYEPGTDDDDIYRMADCGFVIEEGGDLTLDGVRVSGFLGLDGKNVAAPLFWVDGGALTLTNGTWIGNVLGKGTRASGAVVVSAGGTFTMTDGTVIEGCRNNYVDTIAQTGVGAALLVDKGTAYLRGGTIDLSQAYRAAGVNIGNDGTAYVSGELVIVGNTTLDHQASDLVVEDRGQLFLDGDLTGWSQIGYLEGVVGKGTDTNVFARVSPKALAACGGVAGATNYVTSAARFFRDDAPEISGLVVTNATEALLVWSYAAGDGTYRAADGIYGVVNGIRVNKPLGVPGLVYTGQAQTGVVAVVDAYILTGNVGTNAGSYTAVAELKPGYLWDDGSALPKTIDWSIAEAPGPGPGPGPETVTTNYPNPIAFQSIERLSETEWRLVVTNRVPWCRYRLLHTDDLTKGFTETNEWEQATGSAPAAWTNDIPTSGGQYFWKAEGTWGIVPKDE